MFHILITLTLLSPLPERTVEILRPKAYPTMRACQHELFRAYYEERNPWLARLPEGARWMAFGKCVAVH